MSNSANNILANIITITINMVHITVYLRLRRPAVPRFLLGLGALILPQLLPVIHTGINSGWTWPVFVAFYCFFGALLFRYLVFFTNAHNAVFAVFTIASFNSLNMIVSYLVFIQALGYPPDSETFLLVDF